MAHAPHRITVRTGVWLIGSVALSTGFPLAAQSLDRVEVIGYADKPGDRPLQPGVSVLRAADLSRAGVTTAEQALRRIAANQSAQSLSQGVGNFTGSISEADLRGLGPDKTLVLINGRRVANHAYDGASVDLNAIPLAAIERIEVSREGASALHGSGAIGGVVNFILRRDVQGLEVAAEREQPTQRGGATSRGTLVAGLGDLDTEGYNAFVTLDLRQQRALAGSDRRFSKSGIVRGRDAGIRSSRTRRTSFPGDLDGFEPSLAAGCAPPRSVPDAGGNACRYDYASDIDLLPGNRQTTVLAHATLALGSAHTASFEFLNADNTTFNRQTPTATSMVLPESSPFWIAGRPSADFDGQGVGGIANWLTVPAGRRSHETKSAAQRWVATLQGSAAGLRYDTALAYSRNVVSDTLRRGYIDFDRIQQALLGGRVNPFGEQTADGRAAIAAGQLRGRLLGGRGEVVSFDARVSKDLWPLGGGALAASLGVEIQHEKFAYNPAPLAARAADVELDFATQVKGTRQVRALIFDLAAPLTPTLSLNLTARRERSSGTGGIDSHKFALRWQAANALLLHASMSADYRAPTLYEVHAPRLLTSSNAVHDDPMLCPGGVAVSGAPSERVCGVELLQRTGGPTAVGAAASSLRPERSQHASMGLVFEPTKHIAVGVDFWHLRLRDVINSLSDQAVFDNLQRHGSRIVRCSQISAAERASLDGCLDAQGVDAIAFIDTPIENLGRVEAQGIDLALAVNSGSTSAGRFSLSIDASRLTRYDFQRERGGATIDGVGRFADDVPIFRWQHVTQLTWQQGPWVAGVSQLFKSSYRDQDGARTVASYSVVDLSLSYTGIPNLTLTAGLKNAFDRRPPYTSQNETLQLNYDPRVTDPLGRAFAFRLAYQWR